MSRSSRSGRIGAVTVLTATATAERLAVAPASATPFERYPGPNQCLRLERLARSRGPGSAPSCSARTSRDRVAVVTAHFQRSEDRDLTARR